MARLPDGSWLVSFERHHRSGATRRWRRSRCRSTCPTTSAASRSNGGIEALTALADGRIIAISEDYACRRARLVGWIGQPGKDGRYDWQRFQYAKTPDFNPTAIARLPDGSFAIIERAFDMARGVRCRVMRFEASQLKPGGTVHAARAGLARLALCGRQSGGVGRHQGAARRDAAVADLGRQFQSAPAQHPAAVRAGKVKAAYAAFFASFLALAEATRRFSTFISGLSLLSLVPSR